MMELTEDYAKKETTQKHPVRIWSQFWKGAKSWYFLTECYMLFYMLMRNYRTDRGLGMDMDYPSQE